MKIGRCLPADFIKLPRRVPHFSKSHSQTLPMERSKAVELQAICKIVISASSAPSSAGVHRENPFGPLTYKSEACNKGFGLMSQLPCECGTSAPALGLQSHQSEFDHIQTYSVTVARFCVKGRIQQNPTPCGTDPVLSTCTLWARGEGSSWNCCSLCFLRQEGNQLRFSWSGNFMAKCHRLHGRNLLGEHMLLAAIWAFPSTKPLFSRASARGRSTHAPSVGAGCSTQSGHPSSP